MNRKPSKPSYVRERKVPVQIYVYESERDDLRWLQRERGQTASDVIRALIKRSVAASRAPKQPMAADPRQLSLE